MKNMKTSMKLSVSFIIVIVLAIIVGAVGIIGMNTINNADNTLYNINLIAISEMGEIRDEMQRQRNYTRDYVLRIGDSAKLQELQQNMKNSEVEMERFMAAYEATITDVSEEDAYFGAKGIYEGEYASFKHEMISLCLANNKEAAFGLLYAPDAGAMIANMVDGFTTAMNDNRAWAKEQVDANTDLFQTMTIIEVIVLVIAVAVAVFLIFYISGLISKPLQTLTSFMNRAGKTGDITLSPEETDSIRMFSRNKDETGQCIGSTASFIEHMVEVSEKLEKVANGDLTENIEQLSSDDVMGVSLNKMIDNLNAMFTELKSASNQVASGSDQVSQSAQELATGSSEQAASVEELNAAVTEVKGQVDNNAQRSEKALENCDAAVKLMNTSMESMQHMTAAMQSIDESSKDITRVIKVIDDIAFQTNILALNAAVEAARAGQHGKGFAVVADEVRNLAAKSAEAAKETAGLIDDSSHRVSEGSKIVEQTNVSLQAVSVTTTENAVLIREMADSLEKQTASVAEINQGMDQISSVVQANSATAEQSAAASEEMSAQAVLMNNIVARFRLKQSGNNAMMVTGQAASERHSHSTGFAVAGGKY